MQQWAINPKLHGQVIAALCGRMRLEMAMGFTAPLCEDGKPTHAATEYLQMFDADLHFLRECDEDFREAWSGDWRELFSDVDCWAKEVFVKTEAKVISRKTAAVPPPGQRVIDVGDEAEAEDEEMRRGHICEVCGRKSRNWSGHVSHMKAHGTCITSPARFVFSNQCPLCEAVFTTPNAARQHIRRSDEQGLCHFTKKDPLCRHYAN